MLLPKIRLGTLMLLVVIFGLSIALVAVRREEAKRNASAQAEIAGLKSELQTLRMELGDMATQNTIELRRMYDLMTDLHKELLREKGKDSSEERTIDREP
jgi:uncharacterized membrane protein